MRKIKDISEVYGMKFIPNSIRIPKIIMDNVREEAKKNGKSLSKYVTGVLAEQFIEK